MGHSSAVGRTTLVIPGLALSAGLAVAMSNGDTWQRTLVTTMIYGAAALLALGLVTVNPQRRRAKEFQNGGAHRDGAAPGDRP